MAGQQQLPILPGAHHRGREDGNGTVGALLTGVQSEVGVPFDLHPWRRFEVNTNLQ